MLGKFFAVTGDNLYRVVANENGVSIHLIESRKIAPRSKKRFSNVKVMDGHFLAVAKWLQLFNPEKRNGRRPERRLGRVNTLRWQGGTPRIVALFLDEKKARECFASLDLQLCDVRWQKDIREVLEAIGEKHPSIVICSGDGKKLLPV